MVSRRPRIGPRASRLRLAVWRPILLATLIGLWWLLAITAGSGFIPTPLETAWAMVDLAKGTELWIALGSTAASLLVGYGAAIVVGVPVGIAMGGIRSFGLLFNPYVDALSSMPRVAFLPLIIVFLGLGFSAKVFMIFLGAVMPIIVNTQAGVLSSDGELIEMARSVGASDRTIFRTIMLPGAMPYIITGIRIGASLALINTIVAELYTAVSGLGGLLSVYGNSFQMAPYFVIVILLALFGLIIMHGLRLVERTLLRWRRVSTQ